MILNHKKLLALILSFVFIFSVVGCKKDNSDISSTKEELKVLGKVDKYEVPMELYRYVCMNYKADYDGGDTTVWAGEEGARLLGELMDDVDDTIISLYTVLAMCEEYGIDTDSDTVKTALDAQMEAVYSIYQKDMEAYKEELSANYLTDSVFRFLIKNDILAGELVSLMKEKGIIPEYSEDFSKIVSSDEFVRVKQILIQYSNGKTKDENYETIKTIKARLDKGADFDELLDQYGEDLYLFENPAGYYISRGTLLIEFEEAAMLISPGEISDIIELPNGYTIIKGYDKESDYIETNLEELYSSYVDGQYNMILEAKKNTLSLEWNEEQSKYSIFNMK